jgi:hypothetical protein
MNRDPGSPVVTFTETEQSRFKGLAAEVSAESAVQTAMAFERAARVLDQQVTELGIGFPVDRAQRLRMAARASELGNFATRVFELCPDEHLRAIADGQDGSE